MLYSVRLLEFYIVAISKFISEMGIDLLQWTLMVTCNAVHWKIRPSAQHNLISHSITLSWHWENQSLYYPIDAKQQTRKWQVSIWLIIGLTRAGIELRNHIILLTMWCIGIVSVNITEVVCLSQNACSNYDEWWRHALTSLIIADFLSDSISGSF